MAISRKTQKDVGRFEAKFIGPLTVRQAVAVGIAVVIDVIVGLMFHFLGFDMYIIAVACIIIAAPFGLIGFSHPHGLNFEDYAKQYYEDHISSPPVRLYKTETVMEQIQKKKKKETVSKKDKKQESSEKKLVHKENKEYPDYL